MFLHSFRDDRVCCLTGERRSSSDAFKPSDERADRRVGPLIANNVRVIQGAVHIDASTAAMVGSHTTIEILRLRDVLQLGLH
jgi:hypothetical protein